MGNCKGLGICKGGNARSWMNLNTAGYQPCKLFVRVMPMVARNGAGFRANKRAKHNSSNFSRFNSARFALPLSHLLADGLLQVVHQPTAIQKWSRQNCSRFDWLCEKASRYCLVFLFCPTIQVSETHWDLTSG